MSVQLRHVSAALFKIYKGHPLVVMKNKIKKRSHDGAIQVPPNGYVSLYTYCTYAMPPKRGWSLIRTITAATLTILTICQRQSCHNTKGVISNIIPVLETVESDMLD